MKLIKAICLSLLTFAFSLSIINPIILNKDDIRSVNINKGLFLST